MKVCLDVCNRCLKKNGHDHYEKKNANRGRRYFITSYILVNWCQNMSKLNITSPNLVRSLNKKKVLVSIIKGVENVMRSDIFVLRFIGTFWSDKTEIIVLDQLTVPEKKLCSTGINVNPLLIWCGTFPQID
jgi:hypothetical protein